MRSRVALVLGQRAVGIVARVLGRQLAVRADADGVDPRNRLLRAIERHGLQVHHGLVLADRAASLR